MRATIEIDLECSDEDVFEDIVTALLGVLPYMADNVAVRSTVTDRLITPDQRRALFASFGEVFADTTDEARYAFTRMVLALPDFTTVSWSSHKDGSLTYGEASTVLGALRLLNV